MQGLIESRVCVFVTTFNRPQRCEALLRNIAKQGKGNVDVLVFDDCSPEDYSSVKSFVDEIDGWSYHRTDWNHGKKKYWSLVNSIFNLLRRMPRYDYYYMIQDDITICDSFFDKSMALWNTISNPKKISILLLNDSRVEGPKGIWTGYRIKRHKWVSQTQFIDCPAFICTSKLFETLEWKVNPIPMDRWDGRPNISSGVGEQLSHRLNDKGRAMFVSNKSFVRHRHSRSLMNPGDRSKDSLLEFNYIDDDSVTVSIASIPSREKSLSTVINRLSPQVDHINVYLNGYDHVPKFLLSKWITVVRSQDEGNVGDRGKFHWVDSIEGFHFTVDDDILYSVNYVSTMINKLKEYGLRAVVGCHAANLNKNIESYYRSRTVFHFKGALKKDKSVHVLGTGTVAYHTSTIKVRREDFKSNNMADLWFAALGQKQQVPFVSIKRPASWLVPISGIPNDSIYKSSTRGSGDLRDTGKHQTGVAKHFSPWRTFKP